MSRLHPAWALRRALAEAGIAVAHLDDAAVAGLASVAGVTESWSSEKVRLGAPRPAQHAPSEPALAAEDPISPAAAEPAQEEKPCLCEICLRNASAAGSPLIAASAD
jgi:hypothetical protein